MKHITNRIKRLEAVQKKFDDVATVEEYLALIELSITGDVIFEIPDFMEFKQMKMKGG